EHGLVAHQHDAHPLGRRRGGALERRAGHVVAAHRVDGDAWSSSRHQARSIAAAAGAAPRPVPGGGPRRRRGAGDRRLGARLPPMEVRTFDAPSGERLDVAIAQALAVSRTFAKDLVSEGYVTLVDRPVCMPATKLTGHEVVPVLP